MSDKRKEETYEVLEDFLALNDSLVKKIQESISTQDLDRLSLLTKDLPPADLADLYEQLPAIEREILIKVLIDKIDGEFLIHLNDSLRNAIIEIITPKTLAELIRELDNDDAVDIIEGLEESKQRAVLRYVDSEDRYQYKLALSYPENAAARLMTDDYVKVPHIWTVGHVIDMFSKKKDDLPSNFQSVIVVGKENKPLGIVNLSTIIVEKRSATLKSLITEELYTIPGDMPKEDVALLFKQYLLQEAPIIDTDGTLIGIIKIDGIIDVVEEEAIDDIYKLSGVKDGDFYSDVVVTSRLRFPWLFANLLTAVLASWVISFFTDEIEKIVALAVLMPIVASMGGNAGVQTLTVSVRAIATNELTNLNAIRMILKESIVGSLNGFLFALIIGLATYFFYYDFALSLVISISMILNLIVAGFSGIIIPLILDRCRVDPAIASTVVLTTITDVIGFVVFLGFASLVL